MQRRSTPYLILGGGILIASTAAILFKVAQGAGGSALAIAAGRLITATVVISPLAARRASVELRTVRRRDIGLAMLAGVFLALHFAAWFASLEYTSVASSAALVATIPVFVGLASVIFLGERLPRSVIGGIGVAVLGSMVIGVSDSGGVGGPNPLLGDGLAVIGAIAAAGYFLAGQRVQQRLSLLVYIWLTYGTAALVLLIWAIGAGAALTGYNLTFYGAVLGLAVGPQLLGHTAFNWALRSLSATFVAVAALGEPIGSTLLAFILLNETPQPLQLLGGAVLLTGIALATSGERQRSG